MKDYFPCKCGREFKDKIHCSGRRDFELLCQYEPDLQNCYIPDNLKYLEQKYESSLR